MWPFKSRCPEGTIHVWEYDGQFFKTEEAKKEYIFRKREDELRTKFFYCVEAALKQSYSQCIFNTSEMRSLSNWFYGNSKLFLEALRLEAQKDNEKGN